MDIYTAYGHKSFQLETALAARLELVALIESLINGVLPVSRVTVVDGEVGVLPEMPAATDSDLDDARQRRAAQGDAAEPLV